MSGTIVPTQPSVYRSVPTQLPTAKPVVPWNSHSHRFLRARKLAAIFFGVLIFGLGSLQAGVAIHYHDKALPGVTVAGQHIGGLTRHQAQALLLRQVQSFRIKLNVEGKPYDLALTDIGVRYDLDATLDHAFRAGRGEKLAALMLIDTRMHGSVAYAYTVDRKKETAFIKQVVAGGGQAPTDATIAIDNGVPHIVPDVDGHSVSEQAVTAAVEGQVASRKNTVISLHATANQAKIQSETLQPVLEKTKQILATSVTITHQGVSFHPTPAQIGQWLSFEETADEGTPTLKPKIDAAAVKKYLATVAAKIDVKPITRRINVQNGRQQELQAGANGTAMDQDSLASQIATSVMSAKTVTAEAPMKSVSFQTQYNNSVALPYAKYIEINLSTQRLWAYQDHNVVYESPLTSGATGAGFPTITGQFAIQAKERDRYLNGRNLGPGYNYNVFVHYWMPFSGNYGLHDASWRHGSFGGSDYYYGGSHGCVNLPDATAAWLFGWSEVGTPVWVHN